ncbi:MANSC domain-containing protein 1 [Protobothrops mucrosquamatus]|uniref:MANSC domain-containing protein 1 n=1 Tax=Protobothrops mucrosquamatus TaxID=103944 RepID=UPI0007756B51|nr:MANSC domain-containing protein 1 [Protobothrops mucrosquamatus]
MERLACRDSDYQNLPNDYDGNSFENNLSSVSFFLGKEMPKPAPSLNRLSHSSVNGSPASPQAAGFGPPRPLAGPDLLPRTSQKEELFGPAQHPMEEADGPSQRPKAGRTSTGETFASSLLPENSRPASTTQQSPAVKLPFATLDSSTGRAVGAAALHSSASRVPTSAPYAGKTEAATLQPRKGARPKTAKALLSKTGPPHFSSLSATLPSGPSASLPNSHLSDGQLSLEGFGPDGSPARNDFSLLSHQSFLFAALFFEVLFFFLAVVLIGGKLFRSRQPQRYTRLDYLINDMYTNM